MKLFVPPLPPKIELEVLPGDSYEDVALALRDAARLVSRRARTARRRQERGVGKLSEDEMTALMRMFYYVNKVAYDVNVAVADQTKKETKKNDA